MKDNKIPCLKMFPLLLAAFNSVLSFSRMKPVYAVHEAGWQWHSPYVYDDNAGFKTDEMYARINELLRQLSWYFPPQGNNVFPMHVTRGNDLKLYQINFIERQVNRAISEGRIPGESGARLNLVVKELKGYYVPEYDDDPTLSRLSERFSDRLSLYDRP